MTPILLANLNPKDRMNFPAVERLLNPTVRDFLRLLPSPSAPPGPAASAFAMGSQQPENNFRSLRSGQTSTFSVAGLLRRQTEGQEFALVRAQRSDLFSSFPEHHKNAHHFRAVLSSVKRARLRSTISCLANSFSCSAFYLKRPKPRHALGLRALHGQAGEK